MRFHRCGPPNRRLRVGVEHFDERCRRRVVQHDRDERRRVPEHSITFFTFSEQRLEHGASDARSSFGWPELRSGRLRRAKQSRANEPFLPSGPTFVGRERREARHRHASLRNHHLVPRLHLPQVFAQPRLELGDVRARRRVGILFGFRYVTMVVMTTWRVNGSSGSSRSGRLFLLGASGDFTNSGQILLRS